MHRVLSVFRTLLATAAVLMFASSAFAATGINLSWDDCGGAGTSQKTFACTTNGGAPEVIVASVSVGTPMGQLNGHAGVIDLQTNEAVLSAWWNFGGCRAATAISADFNFTLGPFTCMDAWQGAGAGGTNWAFQFNGVPNRGRFKTICAIPGSTAINGDDEYYMFKVIINHTKSTGTGSCAGCVDGACIVLNSILVTQPAPVGDDRTITNPLAQRHVLWQTGGSAIGGLGCPNQVPVRNQTWGSVKSLYR